MQSGRVESYFHLTTVLVPETQIILECQLSSCKALYSNHILYVTNLKIKFSLVSKKVPKIIVVKTVCFNLTLLGLPGMIQDFSSTFTGNFLSKMKVDSPRKGNP